jgi:hypothetical protein
VLEINRNENITDKPHTIPQSLNRNLYTQRHPNPLTVELSGYHLAAKEKPLWAFGLSQCDR